MIILKNLSMPKIGRGEPFGLFENPICCKKSTKIEGGPFEDIKSSRKKSHKVKKSKGILFCTKKCLAEAGTRTRNHWVPLNRLVEVES